MGAFFFCRVANLSALGIIEVLDVGLDDGIDVGLDDGIAVGLGE